MIKTLLVIALILANEPLPTCAMLSDVLKLLSVSKDVVLGFGKVWKILDDRYDFQDTSLDFLKDTQQKIIDKFAAIDERLRSIESASAYRARGIFKSIDRLPSAIKLRLELDRLLELTTRVNVLYESMMRYSNYSQFERFTLENFAKTIVSHDAGSVSDLMGRIHAFIVSPSRGITDTSIFNNLAISLQENNNDPIRCDLGQSPQQIIYHLYYAISLAEFRGYAMLQFSYMLLKLYETGNFAREAQLAEEMYHTRRNQTNRLAREFLQEASRELWRCDAKRHVHKETYLKLTHLMQGYIIQEPELSVSETCTKTCSDYNLVNTYQLYKTKLKPPGKICMGTLHQCTDIEPDVSVCEADVLSGRRYEYIMKTKGGAPLYGRKKRCKTRIKEFSSWTRGLVKCSTCFCFCEETYVRDAVQFFNMRLVQANVQNNMVVTGVRFKEHNKIIHLQIQEGKLLADGEIDRDTVRWVPVEDYAITSRHIYTEQDYCEVTRDNNALDLDDIYATEGRIVTGVRFRKLGTHINLQISVSHFDLSTGMLINPLTDVKFEDNESTLSRSKLSLEDPDEPIQTEEPSIPDSGPNEYINFEQSSVTKDAAQSAVPFLDAQPVESAVPVPLAGVGIFHKGRSGYGGFVALKIITYDFGNHLTTPKAVLEEDASSFI